MSLITADNRLLMIGALFLLLILIRLLKVNDTVGGMDRNVKLATLIIMGLLPALWLVGSLIYAENTMKNVGFCTQCHAMEKYGESLHVDDDEPLSAAHFQNNRISRKEACYECHGDYVAFGGIKSKLRGLRHVYVHYFGTPPDPIELYSPYPNSNCLRCHDGAKNFVNRKQHRLPKGTMNAIRSGRKSCLTDGCHDEAHYFENED